MSRRKKRLGFTDERHEEEYRYMLQAGQKAFDRAKERVANDNCAGALKDIATANFYVGAAVQHAYSGPSNVGGADALGNKLDDLVNGKFSARCLRKGGR